MWSRLHAAKLVLILWMSAGSENHGQLPCCPGCQRQGCSPWSSSLPTLAASSKFQSMTTLSSHQFHHSTSHSFFLFATFCIGLFSLTSPDELCEKKQLSKSSFPSSSSSYFLGRRVTVSRYIKVTLLAFSDFRLAKASKLHLNTSYLQALFARVLLWLLLSFFAMFWHSTHSFYASRSVYLYCGYRGRFSSYKKKRKKSTLVIPSGLSPLVPGKWHTYLHHKLGCGVWNTWVFIRQGGSDSIC